IIENNVSENNVAVADIQATLASVGNRFLGNISLNELYGFVAQARGNTTNTMPKDTVIENHVAVAPKHYGIFVRGAKNTQIRNASTFGGSVGIIADLEAGRVGDGIAQTYSTNCSVTNNTTSGIKTSAQSAWSHDYANAFDTPSSFDPNTNVTHSTTLDPAFGTCRIYLPDSSPLKGKGKGGADIGANVLYRYEDGVLTKEPLWNPTTGEFPCGAQIQGVNDTAGSSCFDVHKRLNVNTNGCAFPKGYGDATTINPPPVISAAQTPDAAVRNDGNLEECGWEQAEWKSFSSSRSDNIVRFATLWDTQHLHIAFDITDSHLESDSDKLYQNDGVEIFVDPGHEGTPALDNNDLHFIADIAGSTTDTSMQVNAITTTQGYTMEISIPWSTLSGTPKQGQIIGILAANNDRDLSVSTQFDANALIESGSYARPDLWSDLLFEAPIDGNNCSIKSRHPVRLSPPAFQTMAAALTAALVQISIVSLPASSPPLANREDGSRDCIARSIQRPCRDATRGSTGMSVGSCGAARL
ncbi:MAG: sugar-binding protein, partial [Myxococcota bacterium]